jgi:sugar-specific transcriptional regulator TrmB
MTTDNFLRDLGLNEKEVEIYSYLAKNGPQKALTVASSLRMHKMQVYRYLDAMNKKGVVSLTFEVPKRFAASPIDKLLKIRIRSLNDKLSNLKKSTDNILSYSGFSFSTQDKLSTFSILQGEEKVEGLVGELISRATEEICVVNRGEYLGKLIKAATNDHSYRPKAEFSSRYIIQGSEKDSAAKSIDPFIKTLFATGCQLHEMTGDNGKLLGLAISDDKEAVLVVEESPITVLWTNNVSVICAIKGFFEKLWTETVEVLPELQSGAYPYH